jgi:hypothetical protein
MKKIFGLPVVEVVNFQVEDIICTSITGGAGGFFGEEDDISGAGTGGGGIELPPDWV